MRNKCRNPRNSKGFTNLSLAAVSLYDWQMHKSEGMKANIAIFLCEGTLLYTLLPHAYQICFSN